MTSLTLFCYTNMAAVMSCVNPLYHWLEQYCYYTSSKSAKNATSIRVMSTDRFYLLLQIIKFSIEEGGNFYFYNNVETFEDEPHLYKVAYEEDLCVLDEIYSRQIFLTPFLRWGYYLFLKRMYPWDLKINLLLDETVWNFSPRFDALVLFSSRWQPY